MGEVYINCARFHSTQEAAEDVTARLLEQLRNGRGIREDPSACRTYAGESQQFQRMLSLMHGVEKTPWYLEKRVICVPKAFSCHMGHLTTILANQNHSWRSIYLVPLAKINTPETVASISPRSLRLPLLL